MAGKAALILVMGFMVLLGYVAWDLTSIATRAQGNMSTYAAETESHNLAITGANVGLAKLYQDTSWRGSRTQDLSGSANGSFTYTVSNAPNGRPFLRSVSFVRGPYETLRDTVEVEFGSQSLQTFTLFAWMTNFEGNVFWITGDTVWGRVHSNSLLHVNGQPVFMEKVTTSKGFDPKPGVGQNKAVFKNGYETGVAEINFPVDLSGVTSAASSGGRYYTGDVTVVLNGGTAADNDGYAVVYNSSGTKIDSFQLNSATFNGALGATGRLSVSGVVDGKLSLFSTDEIYVTDDISYENRTTSSNDVLGLISENDVIIADSPGNKNNAVIDGSIFCRSGSLKAENYNSGTPKGTFNVFGSIVQDTRGAIGTFSGSTLKTGYSKRYRYDDRLADPNFRPPYYPGFYTTTHTISCWWESVHVPKFN
jgi:hypothetical protein